MYFQVVVGVGVGMTLLIKALEDWLHEHFTEQNSTELPSDLVDLILVCKCRHLKSYMTNEK